MLIYEAGTTSGLDWGSRGKRDLDQRSDLEVLSNYTHLVPTGHSSLIIRLFQLIFSAGTMFSLSQQISRNSVSAYFFSEANGAYSR